MHRTFSDWIFFGLCILVTIYWLKPLGMTTEGEIISILIAAGLALIWSRIRRPSATIKSAKIGATVFAVCGSLSVIGAFFDIRTPWD
jgi:predicted membrane metal-binding protein